MKPRALALVKLTEIHSELSAHAVKTGSDILVDLAKKFSEKTDHDEDAPYIVTARSVYLLFYWRRGNDCYHMGFFLYTLEMSRYYNVSIFTA